MIAKKGITIRLKGRTFSMRPGKPVPAVVLAFWDKTGELEGLIRSGAIGETDTIPEVLETPAASGG